MVVLWARSRAACFIVYAQDVAGHRRAISSEPVLGRPFFTSSHRQEDQCFGLPTHLTLQGSSLGWESSEQATEPAIFVGGRLPQHHGQAPTLVLDIYVAE